MKNTIIVNVSANKLHFYMNTNAGRLYLFSQKFSKGVFTFFKHGRSESEIKKFKDWNRNPRLDKTINKIPMYVQYALREYANCL